MQTIYRPYKDGHQVDPLRPIFYVVQHVKTGIYYAGYKSNVKPFMEKDGYHTSSKLVKDIIAVEGLNAFVVRYVRYFIDACAAHVHEIAFLQKVNARKNHRFYNQTNGDENFITKHISRVTKDKMRLAKRNMPLEKRRQWIARLSIAGKNRSLLHLDRLSKACRVSNRKSALRRSEMMRGIPLSEEIKLKLRKYHANLTEQAKYRINQTISKSLREMSENKKKLWIERLKSAAKERPKFKEQSKRKASISIKKALAERRQEIILSYIAL